MLRYADFISDLRRLVAEAKRLRSHSEMHLDPAFRRWRHELETSLSEVQKAGFELPGLVRIQFRSFGHRSGLGYSNDKLFAMYQREIDDTVIELETIISEYERRGAPKKRKPSDVKPGEWPAKITLAWLWHNVPVHLWIALLSALLGAFALGTQVCQSELYKQAAEAITGVPSVTNEPPSPTDPSGATVAVARLC